MANVNLTGFRELDELLQTLPAKMEQNIIRGALRVGANVIKKDAQRRCPVGPPSQEGVRQYRLYEGALRDSIRVSVRARKGRVTASVKAGGKQKNGANVWYAHIIEFTGAKRHPIKSKNGPLSIFGRFVSQVDDHPGMRAKPFLRPALDSQADNAVKAAGEYIKKRLATKHGLDTADIEIGVE